MHGSKPIKVGRKDGIIPYPKGRQAEARALEEVRELIPTPYRRDMLIEYFHLIQRKRSALPRRHLEALAELMKLPFAEVYEVATFYAHFKVIEDDETPPKLVIRVCDGLSCELKNGNRLLAFKETSPGVAVEPAPCMGLCHKAPVAMVGDRTVANADGAALKAAVKAARSPLPPTPKFSPGQLPIWRKVKSGDLKTEKVLQILEEADLRGMGGAGFPAAKKWRAVIQEPAPRLMTVNADEGEPGTFKDRWFMEEKLSQTLEGMLIAAHAVRARAIYFYIRGEYPCLYDKVKAAFTELEKLTPGIELHLRLGAGAYICGEESAMIESIEGKRGLPRHRPPYIASVGLFGMPTLNHNVETLYWVSEILKNTETSGRGGGWYAKQGLNGGKGLRAFSVSGRVAKPGVKIAPVGITFAQLLDEYCGGMEKGRELGGYLPGGASGGILPASMANLPLDFGALEKYGCFVGSGAVIVFAETDDIRAITLNLLKFFEDESCGQCTPCRVGTEKSVKLLSEKNWNKELLEDTIQVMSDASICGLGQAAGNPIACALKYFDNPADKGENGSAE